MTETIYKQGRIINGDCLDIMDELIKEGIKVDCVITDLPYNTTACKWDKEVINLEEMWAKLNKLTKDNTPIVRFGSQPFTTKLISSNIKNFREEIIWLKNKAGSGLQAKQKHIKIHENILVFSKSGSYTFKPQKWGVEEKEFLTQRKTSKEVEVGNNIYSKMTKTQKVDDGTRNPVSIVSYRVPFTPSKSKTYSKEIDIRIHETQKPLKLLEYLINSFSNQNELVLDITAGSMSLAHACINTNRRFICIEKDEHYYNVGINRINNCIEDIKDEP